MSNRIFIENNCRSYGHDCGNMLKYKKMWEVRHLKEEIQQKRNIVLRKTALAGKDGDQHALDSSDALPVGWASSTKSLFDGMGNVLGISHIWDHPVTVLEGREGDDTGDLIQEDYLKLFESTAGMGKTIFLRSLIKVKELGETRLLQRLPFYSSELNSLDFKQANNGKFGKRVRQRVGTLDETQIVHFIWLCAVRSLPFLCFQGESFSYWHASKRDEYLYSIFRSLDIMASYCLNIEKSVLLPTADLDTAATEATLTAPDAAITVKATLVGLCATYSVEEAVNCAAYAASLVGKGQIEEILLDDIDHIRSGLFFKHDKGIKLYGRYWDNFFEELDAIGFGYWGKVYADLFAQRFRLRAESVSQRMNVPDEILSEGARAVTRYLTAQEAQGSIRLNEARIILLGEKGSGKTSLARRLVYPDALMPNAKDSTEGVEISSCSLADLAENISEEQNARVRIWDFAGHAVTHAAHRFFLSERCLYIIVHDGRTDDRSRLEYWLDHVKNYGGDSKVFIVVNLKDDHRPEITENRLLARYARQIQGFYYFSIKDGNHAGLEDFRVTLAHVIAAHPAWNLQTIGQTDYAVKEELEQLFLQRKNFITKDEFHSLATKLPKEEHDRLLHALTCLGICLWYPSLEKMDTLVLNPDWITNGVYKIINWLKDTKKGHEISLDEFGSVFEQESTQYPASKYAFFYDLMLQYELAYEIPQTKHLVVPQCLPEDQPIAERLLVFPPETSLYMECSAIIREEGKRLRTIFPPDVVSRLIVRHHDEICCEIDKEKWQQQFSDSYLALHKLNLVSDSDDVSKFLSPDQLIWRSGVVLLDGNNMALLKQEDDSCITLQVKGEGRTKYLSALRATLENILSNYKSFAENRPTLSYAIINEEGHRQPGMMEQTALVNLLQNGMQTYLDAATMRTIPIVVMGNYYDVRGDFRSDSDNVQDDHSLNTTYNFNECTWTLQGVIRDIMSHLSEENEELKALDAALAEVEDSKEPMKDVIKKGVRAKLERLQEQLDNPDSALRKTINALGNGAKILAQLAKAYNDFAPICGLPSVPGG